MSGTDNTRPAKFRGRECFNADPERDRLKPARESFDEDRPPAPKKPSRKQLEDELAAAKAEIERLRSAE